MLINDVNITFEIGRSGVVAFIGPEAIEGGGQVYRCYDVRGNLLYIGSSKDARNRVMHGGYCLTPYPSQNWLNRLVYVLVENHPTRAAAFEAESAAQRVEPVTEFPMTKAEKDAQWERLKDM
jgi:hypothetical protein